MSISIYTIVEEMSDYIKGKSLRGDTGLELEQCAYFDADTTPDRHYVYFCAASDFLACKNTHIAGSFVLKGDVPIRSFDDYGRCNILLVDGLSEKRLLNLLIGILSDYRALIQRFERSVYRDESLQVIINNAASITKRPMGMLDVNHNTIVCSTNYMHDADPLLDIIQRGYGYQHKDVIDSSYPKLDEVAGLTPPTVEVMGNISKCYLKVTIFKVASHPVGSMGMHQLPGQGKFPPGKIQLFDYIFGVMEKYVSQNPGVFKLERGKAYEAFLLDLIEGKLTDQAKITSLANQFGIPAAGKYHLLVAEDLSRKLQKYDTRFIMLNNLEFLLPGTKCAMSKDRLFALIPLEESSIYISSEPCRRIELILSQYCSQWTALMTSPFSRIEELSQMARQALVILQNLPSQESQGHILHAYNYFSDFCFHQLKEYIPLYTCVHPLIRQLMKYDKEHGTDYVRTLRVFLTNNCSVSASASIMFLHRNSMLHRLDNIESILNVSLDNQETVLRLLFAYFCMSFIDPNDILL